MRAPKACNTPGCPESQPCPTHRPATRRSPSSRVTGTRRWREKTKPAVLTPGARCHYCPAPATTVDHVIAVGNGGAQHDEANLVPCCKSCNARKNAR